MRQGCLGVVGLLAMAGTVLSLPHVAAGQAATTAAAAESATTLRTPWGVPSLQGIWTNSTSIPFEPFDLRALAAAQDGDAAPQDSRSVGAYNAFWSERGANERGVNEGGVRSDRRSLIVDPPDGKLPSLTTAAELRADTLEKVRRPERPASPTDLNPFDRCITRGMPGAMMPGFYNHNYHIVQTPDHVAILIEMIHDVRIIPIGGGAQRNPEVPQWMGTSRGHWEGDTLVVETTGFSDKLWEFTGTAMRTAGGDPQIRFHGVFGSPTLTLVERFIRVDEHTMDYEFTVTDPATFASPFTVSAPMAQIVGPVYEYACHEGNYALESMLGAARAQE